MLYCVCWFLYFWLALLPTGQTIGMLIVGIKLRNSSNGSDYFTNGQAALRTLVLPLTLTIMPPLGAIGYFRRDGRMLHDIVAGTGLVYAWDAQMAKARRKAETRMEQMQYNQSPDETSLNTSETEASVSQSLQDQDPNRRSINGSTRIGVKPLDSIGTKTSGKNKDD